MSFDVHETIFSPGATRSGFIRPSPVGPLEEKYETPYTCGMSRCVEPTVIARSAFPGSLIESSMPAATVPRNAVACHPYPVLPAATTTATPDFTSRLTSTQRGL